jgi:hypothetical protein
MSIEQQVHDAFDDLDGLLLDGLSVGEAIAQAATGNGLQPDVFRARAEHRLVDLELHRGRVELRALWAAHERERREFERKLRKDADAAAEAIYYEHNLDDPVRAGRPSWPIAIAGFTERLQISDYRLRQTVQRAFYVVLRRLDRKHGTSEVRLLGVENPVYRPPRPPTDENSDQ